jgi:Fe-S cluster assembly protein SufD
METLTAPLNIEDEYSQLFQENIDLLTKETSSFLAGKRLEAMEAFRTLGIPNKKNENYKYTDLQPFFKNSFRKKLIPKNITFKLDDIFRCDIPELQSDIEIILNGHYYDTLKPAKDYGEGVIAGSLAQAALQYPEIIQKHYGRYADHTKEGLVALNTALARDGFFLYVPKGMHLEKPIQVINMLMSDEPLFAQQRNLIILEEGASASLVICDHTLSPEKFLGNNLSEIYAGPDSHLDITRLQNEHNGASQVNSQYITQDTNSHVTLNTITLHGGMVRNNLFVKMDGEGAENFSHGLFLTDYGQHIDTYTFIDHAKPHCTSFQHFKGVLDDFSTGAFNGRILVRRDAQKTLAYQKNNNLLLTNDAKMNSKPQLEIYADDVKCSHGATMGQLDQEAMFYLQSRGIGKEESRMLLMYAFANEIIEKIKVEPIRERIDELVGKRLRGELSRCHNCAMHCC